jgi:putative ABC transport system ATP-binding protein
MHTAIKLRKKFTYHVIALYCSPISVTRRLIDSTDYRRGAMVATRDAPLLSAHGLACTLAQRCLWRDVTLCVHPGERWAVAGPSGSGKTQLLRTLAGLTAPSAGDIRFGGRALAAWWMPAYRARVVYIPQRPSLPETTVEAALAVPFGLRMHRGKVFSSAAARRYLDALGMNASFLTQRTEKLSGGETQIVATLRAVLIEPTLLLLDEPTTSLDAARAERIEALIGDWLERDHGRAYVWTSHDRDQLARVSDKILTLGTT